MVFKLELIFVSFFVFFVFVGGGIVKLFLSRLSCLWVLVFMFILLNFVVFLVNFVILVESILLK